MSRWHERDFEAEDEAEYPRRRAGGGLWAGLAKLGFVVGAVTIVAGSVWFGFRHSAGISDEASLPLIKADPRPLKSRPAQPGGMEVPNQDKLVFDRLDPGAAPPMVERLLPPPEAPLPRPVAPVTPPPSAEGAPGKTASRTAIDTVMAPPPMPLRSGLPGEVSPATQQMPDVAPPPLPLAVVPASPAPPAAGAKPGTVPGAGSKPATSPPLALKPGALPPTTAKSATTPPLALKPGVTPPATTKPATTPPQSVGKPTPLTGGSVRVQVGAVLSEADARGEWKRLQSRHPELLGGLSLTVTRVDLGEKGVRFRLQGGPVDEARARFICDQLKGQNLGCQLARN